ncbi:ABC transporter ATP-binding protein [Nocardioides sp. QY071]|uniref:oligopeptide/dipeptide ABC transporter ATP-binding protein n=1 Tax=Nocardioides sp. QY071 TaxID=3044187 RepID=UPI00249BBCD2|nr:ABC transporter ATP-binding protein [Nocardioides sp. QY071]WGY01688.1 ABC transporter ATP-binding protein [Nocardioides sp. QY071]
MNDSALLKVEDLTKSYPTERRKLLREATTFFALDHVSIELGRDETLALVGESGSGKSTLAGIVTRLTDADDGTVEFDGHDVLGMGRTALRKLRPRMQMVFQNPYGSLNPQLAIGRAITEPAVVHGTLGGLTRGAYAKDLLERVGLPASMASRLPRELSGGQRQRIAIARALSVKPDLLIADEAVSALDLPVQAQILNLLEGLRAELGISILFISHQLPVVAHIADRVAVMYLGRIVEVGPVETIFKHPAHPYTVGLLAAQPGRHQRTSVKAPRERRPDVSVAELQSTGCRYRDRCPAATELCSIERPPVVELGGTHSAECHYPAALPMPVPPAVSNLPLRPDIDDASAMHSG